MKTNLIQSYANGTPEVQQYNSNKIEKDFDVNKELATHTFIRPLPSNGHLVKNTIFDMPADIYNGAKYNVKALIHSAKGDASDYELGKVNDLGMRLGGLVIASYLYARKATPLTKVMEFVGFGSFFAAMDIWPKLALQLPAYLIHGVNIRQKYVDNYGRKKLFYQDHQFIPWDLYSDEEINKIGDRMNVPKNMKNRRDYIQEKMRKIALQNNTMWMLTSGFATPVMSALICNALENPISEWQKGRKVAKADKLLTDFPQEIQKYHFNEEAEKLNALLSQYKDKNLTKEAYSQIVELITKGIDPVTSEALVKDLRQILPSQELFSVNAQVAEHVTETLRKNLTDMKIPQDIISAIIPDSKSIEEALKSKGLLNDNIKDFSEHIKTIQSLMIENINKYAEQNPGSAIVKKLNLYRKKLIHSQNRGEDSELAKSFKIKFSEVLSQGTIDKLKNIKNILNDFRAKGIVLRQYAYIKYAQAPETVLADEWNDISRQMVKILGITDKEIKDTRYDRKFMAKLLRDKFEYIVSNDTRYNEIINALQAQLSKLPEERTFESSDGAKIGDRVYTDKVNSTFNEISSALRKLGLNSGADALNGYNEEGATGLKYIYLKFAQDRVMGVKSSFYRLLNTLDAYRRISKIQNVDYVLNSSMPREVKEELVELCKNILISGHSADFAVKFYCRRNPERNPNIKPQDYYSQIETKDGKVVNKYFNPKNSSEMVELANDRNFFEAAMKLMFGGELHPDTMTGIRDSVFAQDFLNYRKEVLKYLGGDKYFAKPNHLVNGQEIKSSSLLKRLLLGSALDEMFSKQCRQNFNNTKWLKKFGILGAALFGVTVISQFFMGRMPKPPKESEQ